MFEVDLCLNQEKGKAAQYLDQSTAERILLQVVLFIYFILFCFVFGSVLMSNFPTPYGSELAMHIARYWPLHTIMIVALLASLRWVITPYAWYMVVGGITAFSNQQCYISTLNHTKKHTHHTLFLDSMLHGLFKVSGGHGYGFHIRHGYFAFLGWKLH